MPETMLRPSILAVLAVVDLLAQERRFAVATSQEERVSLGGNRHAPELPLLAGLWVAVVGFDLEDRFFHRTPIAGIQSIQETDNLVHIHPFQSADRLAPVFGPIRTTRTRNEPTLFARDDRHRVGV